MTVVISFSRVFLSCAALIFERKCYYRTTVVVRDSGEYSLDSRRCHWLKPPAAFYSPIVVLLYARPRALRAALGVSPAPPAESAALVLLGPGLEFHRNVTGPHTSFKYQGARRWDRSYEDTSVGRKCPAQYTEQKSWPLHVCQV